MTHSLGEVWALNDSHRGRGDDHIAHGFCTDLARAHVLHAAGAILGYGSIELYLLPRIYCVSYSTTETPQNSALPLLGARPGFSPTLG